MPDISVVIPIYNKEDYIKETLESVLNQSFQNFEVLIIDDGSTDRSRKIIEDFKDKRIRFYTQSNQGVSKARNKAVSLSQAPLIAFLDADDLWYPNHLQEMYDLYKKFPKAGFFATAYSIKYNNKLQKDFIFEFNKPQIELEKYYRYLNGVFLFYTSNFGIKKTVFEKENGFSLGIHGEDTELFLRLGLKYSLAYSQQVTLLHIDGAKNSLFKNYNIDKKKAILQTFTEQEKTDKHLKRILDNSRYAWAIEYLLLGKKSEANELIRNIDKKNLNKKQLFLLNTPSFLIRLFKKIHLKLIQSGYYVTSFNK